MLHAWHIDNLRFAGHMTPQSRTGKKVGFWIGVTSGCTASCRDGTADETNPETSGKIFDKGKGARIYWSTVVPSASMIPGRETDTGETCAKPRVVGREGDAGLEAHLVVFVGLHRDSLNFQLVRSILVGIVQSNLGVEERVRRAALRLPGRVNTIRLELERVAAVGNVRADPEVGVLVHLVLPMDRERRGTGGHGNRERGVGIHWSRSQTNRAWSARTYSRGGSGGQSVGCRAQTPGVSDVAL